MRLSEAPTYTLHGLRVRSEVPLPAATVDTREIDLDVRWGHRQMIQGAPLPGAVLASLEFGDGKGYALTRTISGWTLRFLTIGEFRFDPELRRARVHLAPRGDPAIVPLLVTGNVAAFVLSLRGRCILHASAVEVDGEGFGFLGGSGTGKSTVAALCCANGARLITDDVLRLDYAAGAFRCVRGPAEIRLREGSASLAEQFARGARRPTVDGRLGVHVASAADDHVPLRLLAIPRPTCDAREIRIERLNRVDALYALTRFARIVGWRAPDLIASQFTRFAPVATGVPVYEVQIPWGPPFAETLGSELVGKLSARLR